MGFVTSIECGEMPAAIGMATECIRVKYNEGTGGVDLVLQTTKLELSMDDARVIGRCRMYNNIAGRS